MIKPILKGCGYSLTLLFLLVGNALGEQSSDQPALSSQQCADLEQSQQRLACFDKLSALSGSSGTGSWRLERRAETFGEGEIQAFYLPAQTPVRSKNQTVTPQLAVYCNPDGVNVEINWYIYLGKNRTTLQTQFDGEAVLQKKWLIDDDDKRSIRFNDDAAVFVVMLLDHQTLQAKIKPHNGSPIIATFALDGLAAISRSADCFK